MSKIINTTLDDVYRASPIGSIQDSIASNFYGINHRLQPSPIPINKDMHGLTFFTRPQLNLTNQNLRAYRKFIPFLTNQEMSIQRIIRCYLDPRLNAVVPSLSCPFVDHLNPFIPILTNHLITCNGWPDISLDSYESKPGAYKEVFSMVDSTAEIYSAYDISATFRNMVGDPITTIFALWAIYQSLVFQGIMVPYPDFLIKNEYDYNTRIYRLVLDSTRRYVEKIGCTGAAYPTAVPMGAAFNFDSDVGKPLNLSNAEIQINFRCMGACYQDDIISYEFNKVGQIFNSNMQDDRRSTNMQKIPIEMLATFNHRGYPRINPKNGELEWYVGRQEYNDVVGVFRRHISALNIPTSKTQEIDRTATVLNV